MLRCRECLERPAVPRLVETGHTTTKSTEGIYLRAVLFFVLPLVLAFFMLSNGYVVAANEPRADVDGAAFAPTVVQPISVPVTAVPDTPVPATPERHRVIDKKFVAIMGALGATEALRFTTNQLVLEHEKAAGAPWVTSTPAPAHLVIKYSPIFTAEVLLAYELKKPHAWLPGDRIVRKFWWLYPAAMAPLYLKNAIGSIRTQAPSGMP